MTFSLRFAAHSEVGRIRKNNQDAGYASPTMLLVADGMGGAAAGDLASAVAATEAARSDAQCEVRNADGEEMLERIAGMIARSNSKLSDLIESNLELDGMGTTFCGALFNGTQFGLAHIGDSRGYLLRDGELTQLTHDHSWVQSLIDEGKITPAQAATHPHRSLILKVLNGQPGFEADLFELDLELGDRVLFCSDGLSGLISDDTMRELLAEEALDDAIEDLAIAANEAGGHDNITLVVAEVVEQDELLDEMPGRLFGSAVEIEVPKIGELAVKSGKPSGYPEAARPVEPDESTEQEPGEAARYAPKEARHRWPGFLIAAMAIALVIGGSAWGIQTYAQSRYFIAADQGEVAVFNGLPGSLLGYPLHTITEHTDILVEDLPAFQQRAVRNTIGVSDEEAAKSTTAQLRDLAHRCRANREARLAPQEPAPSPSPSPSPTIPGLPVAPGSPAANDVEPGYPTHLAPMTPTATAEADPEHC